MKLQILSPIPPGSGAYVLHQQIASRIRGYRLRPYSPWWTVFPPVLPLFSSRHADLIHTSFEYGAFFRRKGAPLVVTAHNYVSDRFMRAYSSPLQYLHYRTDLRLFTRWSAAVADQIVAISQFIADKVREEIAPQTSMRLIYNGIDEQRFTPVKPCGRKPGRPLRVLFCGNLNRRKRSHLLVPLAEALGGGFEVHYTAGLAGAAALAGSKKMGAAALRNLDSVAYADMPDVYRSMDLLFMPSVREGFGLCVAEAMACGLPVVAADSGALPELVEHGRGGYLCPIDDLSAYVEAIQRIAESPELSRQMGQYNRARVEERFTLSRMANEYRLLFEQLLDLRSPAHRMSHEVG